MQQDIAKTDNIEKSVYTATQQRIKLSTSVTDQTLLMLHIPCMRSKGSVCAAKFGMLEPGVAYNPITPSLRIDLSVHSGFRVVCFIIKFIQPLTF